MYMCGSVQDATFQAVSVYTIMQQLSLILQGQNYKFRCLWAFTWDTAKVHVCTSMIQLTFVMYMEVTSSVVSMPEWVMEWNGMEWGLFDLCTNYRLHPLSLLVDLCGLNAQVGDGMEWNGGS